jgi:8-oxo-dGTP diphosphatase
MRADIRREVSSIKPLDERERTHKSDALTWIDSGAPLCRRSSRRFLGNTWSHTSRCRKTVARELEEELGVVGSHEIAIPLMITCTTTVGLTAGHVDVPLNRSDPHMRRFLQKLRGLDQAFLNNADVPN